MRLRKNYTIRFKIKDLRLKPDDGFTLIEVLVVMGIVAVLGSLGYLVTIDFYKSYSFNSERDMVVSLLQKARAEALSNINQSAHGLHFDDANKQYVVFQGQDYASRNSAFDQNISYASGITRSGITDVVFDQLSGNAHPSPSSSLTLDDGKRVTVISLNPQGQINW